MSPSQAYHTAFIPSNIKPYPFIHPCMFNAECPTFLQLILSSGDNPNGSVSFIGLPWT